MSKVRMNLQWRWIDKFRSKPDFSRNFFKLKTKLNTLYRSVSICNGEWWLDKGLSEERWMQHWPVGTGTTHPVASLRWWGESRLKGGHAFWPPWKLSKSPSIGGTFLLNVSVGNTPPTVFYSVDDVRFFDFLSNVKGVFDVKFNCDLFAENLST